MIRGHLFQVEFKQAWLSFCLYGNSVIYKAHALESHKLCMHVHLYTHTRTGKNKTLWKNSMGYNFCQALFIAAPGWVDMPAHWFKQIQWTAKEERKAALCAFACTNFSKFSDVYMSDLCTYVRKLGNYSFRLPTLSVPFLLTLEMKAKGKT